MGLLNFPGMDTAEGQGLLSAAMSLLSAQKMPGQRGSLANALGQAGQAYMGGTNSAQKAMLQNKYMQAQVDENDYQNKARQAALERDQRKRTALPGLFGMQGNGALTSPGMGSGQIDTMAALQAGYTPDEITKLGGLQNLGRQERSYSQDVEGPNGQKILRSFDKYGSAIPGDVSGYVAPQLVNQGDRQSFVKPSAGLSLPVGMSPSERDSSARGWAGNSLARERLNFDQNGGSEGGITQSGFNKQFGKPPAGYRWKPDGGMEFIPGGPADQKSMLQKSGEGTVGGVVADLRDKYNVLDAENGVVSTKNRFGTNMGAWAGATGIGQTLNGMVGTKTQSARDSIAMTRPLLLQAIMKATGMSAKQMDSNTELKLYLSTATDPTKGLEANMAALDRLEVLYGGGKQDTKAPKASGGWSIQKAD